MSLINEALKRAERQRRETPPAAPSLMVGSPAPPTPPVAAPAYVAPRRPPAPRRNLALPLAGVALIGVAVTAYFFLRPDETTAPVHPAINPPAIANAAPAAPASTPRPVAPVPSPLEPEPKAASAPDVTAVASTKADTTPTVTFPPPGISVPDITTPAEPIADLNPAPPPPAVVPVPSPAPAPVTPPSVVAPVTPPVPATPKPDPRVAAFLDAIHVTAILPSATSPKVIMNGQVYRLNDLVDRPTGLRITKIASNSLAFRDGAGFEYSHELHP